MIALFSSLFLACGPSWEAPEGLGVEAAPKIVNGTREPQTVSLTDGEILALGYLSGSDGWEYCSGTLIMPRMVVTAKHCIQGEDPEDVFFGLGDNPRHPAAQLPVAEIHRAPQGADQAILVLGLDERELVPELEYIPINRESISGDWEGRWVDAAGFGDTYAQSSGLFFAKVELYDYDSEMVYVDGHGEQGICYGDSGGPVIWQDEEEDTPVVVGTEVTGDSSCVDKDELTRVDIHANWIDGIAANLPGTLEACGDLSEEGECDGNVVRWCEGGYAHQQDCGEASCGWLGENKGYECLPEECGDVDFYGACDGDTLLRCWSVGLQEMDCAADGMICGNDPDGEGQSCVCDEGWYSDDDGDGFGDADSPRPLGEDCEGGDGFVQDDSDCDDSDAQTFPGAPESELEEIDRDCDGIAPDLGGATGTPGLAASGCAACATGGRRGGGGWLSFLGLVALAWCRRDSRPR